LVTIADICNLALSHIGESTPVASVAPADGTAGADACSRFYNLAIQECLERHAWGFATRRHELVLVDDEEHPNYEHVYEVPADVLAPTKVMREGDRDDSEGMPRVQWVIEDNADGDRRLYTNQEALTLVYVTSLANRDRYSPLFITYASWVLAAMVAPYLMKGTAGAEAALRCEQMAALKLREAMAQDNKARKVIADHVPGAIRARG
jgi:hypothetical protein